MNKILLLFLFVLTSYLGRGQSRLVLNGAIMTLSDSVYLVVDNPAANAITRTSGHIISEGESNQLKWNIANVVGTYIVPGVMARPIICLFHLLKPPARELAAFYSQRITRPGRTATSFLQVLRLLTGRQAIIPLTCSTGSGRSTRRDTRLNQALQT